MQDYECNGSVDVRGPGDAQTILFLHGLAWNRKMWVYQQEVLEKEFSVVAIDLPGHGSQAHKPFQFEEAIQTVMNSITCTTKRQVLLVGLSLGGYIAISCAHRYPERIAGLVISGSCVAYRGWLGLLAHLNGLLFTHIYRENTLVPMQEQALLSSYPAEYAKPIIEAGFHFKTSGSAFSSLAGKNFHKQLRTYTGPVLILNGEHDVRNRKAEQTMLASAQHAQLAIVENAGHLCNMDQPSNFTQAIADFAYTIPWETKDI